MVQSELVADLTLARRLAAEAGEIAMRYFRTRLDVTDKGGRDDPNPLTEADLAVDTFLREELTGARPDYGWLSEETADTPERLDCERVWVVDPIDGTREFVEGIPEFAVSVGLIVDGEPRLGAVHHPPSATTYWGGRELGSGRNGETPLRPSGCRMLAEARLAGSRSQMRKGMFDRYQGALTDIKAVGSTAYKAALVAAGEYDLYLTEDPRSEWDLAGGVAILLGSGAPVATAQGGALAWNQPRPLLPSFACAGNAGLLEQMLGLIGR